MRELLSCFFVSDLHGKIERYKKLFETIQKEKPKVVFIGGDILPFCLSSINIGNDFIFNFLKPKFHELKESLKEDYPEIFLIMGNDDPRNMEKPIIELSELGLYSYIHQKREKYLDWDIYGYSYIPPTPFMLKDWERYDVSRSVDPGCYPPESGKCTTLISTDELKFTTIKKDLDELTSANSLEKAVFLFHSPPYNTNLDRAALDGKFIDGDRIDPFIGSKAIKSLIESRQPHLTMHGHVHESYKLTGVWQEKLGRTTMFNAAYHTRELSIIKFDLENPQNATREII